MRSICWERVSVQLILSAYLVPVFGFLKTAMLILVLNLATALLAFTAALREKRLPA